MAVVSVLECMDPEMVGSLVQATFCVGLEAEALALKLLRRVLLGQRYSLAWTPTSPIRLLLLLD